MAVFKYTYAGWAALAAFLLVAVLVMFAVYSFTPPPHIASGRADDARLMIHRLCVALDDFHTDNSRFPTTAEGLEALAINPGSVTWRGYFTHPIPLDPWGRPYRYIYPGLNGKVFRLSSDGPDGIDGTADDIISP